MEIKKNIVKIINKKISLRIEKFEKIYAKIINKKINLKKWKLKKIL